MVGPIDRSPAIGDLSFHPNDQKIRSLLLDWYDNEDRQLPWRVLWKKHSDPYHIWLSEIMLQQTVISVVIPVYERFLENYPNVKSVAEASEEDLKLAVRGLGYYRRFGLFHKACQYLTEHRLKNGRIEWPHRYEDWLSIPGVGPYTAAAVSSIAFSQVAGVVDGNVERVFCRLFDIRLPANHKSLKKSFKRASDEIVDQTRPGDFNQALMQLGQLICKPKTPDCGSCPLSFCCLAKERGSTDKAPAAKPKKTFTNVKMDLVIPVNNEKIGLIERSVSSRFLKGTRGFLTYTNLNSEKRSRLDGLHLELDKRSLRSVSTINHNITHHKITADIHQLDHKSLHPDLDITWHLKSDIEKNLVSNLDRKAWKSYLKSLSQPELFSFTKAND